MSDEVLEKLTADYLKLQLPVYGFSWQGGEPTLMGLDFYRKAVELQKQYGGDRQVITNSLQTNAILLDDEWCSFLSDNDFLVGISLDGPKEFHDYYRIDHAGKGSFDRVMQAIDNCKKHNVQFNVLVLVNDRNADHPDELFDFFIQQKINYLQFIPCLEKDPETNNTAEFSVSPRQFGKFLCRIFDRWYDYGPTKLSIRDFDSIISYYVTGSHTICTFNKQCSDYIVIEHTGDAFVCDFFVRPQWRLGNIFDTPIEQLASSDKKKQFARSKGKLCNRCLVCRHLELCRGGCLKDRIVHKDETFSQESYFCESYKMFFEHSLGRFMQLTASVTEKMNQRHPTR